MLTIFKGNWFEFRDGKGIWKYRPKRIVCEKRASLIFLCVFNIWKLITTRLIFFWHFFLWEHDRENFEEYAHCNFKIVYRVLQEGGFKNECKKYTKSDFAKEMAPFFQTWADTTWALII